MGLDLRVARAAFGQPVGEVGPVLELPYGFHVLRVEERTEEAQRPLEEVARYLVESAGGIAEIAPNGLAGVTMFGDADYDALAAAVNRNVAYAVERCKLAPAADAQLHLVIAELLAGAEAMEGKAAAPRHDGAVRVAQALKSYAKYFRHPGFKAAGG